MFGDLVRAALSIPIAVLVGKLLEWILGFILPLYASEDTNLYAALSAVQEHAIFIMLIGIGASLIARATIKARVGPGGVR